jgi:hypothetical protein
MMDMEIKAVFKDRRAADLSLEHLVQEVGLERTDIFIVARGGRNTSGTEPAGADAQGSLAESRTAAPALEGQIEMSVGCDQDKVERVSKALQENGGSII